MASYFSGFVSSVKGMLGFETLEIENSGTNEQQSTANTEQRQSLWKQLSSFIGKDVTSMISLPVWVFEPLSFLQIMCEPMQFAELLHKASENADSCNRMAFLIAFVTSGYSCAARQKKPFNPILGETFEYIASDKRWKFFAEQVSHHPPIGVAEAISEAFKLTLEMALRTKFRGNSSDVFVDGTNHFYTTQYNDHFSWNHLDTCAHNVIIGGMWVDHFGTLEVKNHTTGDRGIVRFTKSGWLGAGRFELSGEIYDSKGNLRLKVVGRWNEVVSVIKVQEDGTEATPVTLWKKNLKAPTNKWGWSKATEDLNTMDAEYEAVLPATDSRVRSDRRHLEHEDLDTAAAEKHRLEEKQRADRREREAKHEHWTPRYFQKVEEEDGKSTWKYIGNYWEEREQRIQQYQLSKQQQQQQQESATAESSSTELTQPSSTADSSSEATTTTSTETSEVQTEQPATSPADEQPSP